MTIALNRLVTPGCRILVACSMKSGSSYVAKVLSEYFGIPYENSLIDYWGYREQNLHPWQFEHLFGSSFVLQMHIKPYPPHLKLVENYGVKVVYHWRNLGDVLISFDDHNSIYHWENPVCYIDNGVQYFNLSRQDRYRFLIHHAIPWYVAFYLSWRKLGNPGWLVRSHYESMVADPFAHFSSIISGFDEELDSERLKSAISTSPDGTRLNVGKVGRSSEMLSDENKALLERLLIEHPEDLSELLEELPWWPSRLGQSPEAQRYDGRLIRVPGNSPEEQKVFFVHHGKRCWISSMNWILSRGMAANIQVISPAELRAIPIGPTISTP